MKIETDYFLDRHKRVIRVEFTSDGQSATAELKKVDGEYTGTEYLFNSYLHGDSEAKWASPEMSLADCILAAYVLLGVIPPQNFDPINCSNKH